MSSACFPAGFLWGTATSSHQVEGRNQNSDWWAWEQGPGRIRDGARAGDAAGWWAGMAEKDLALAARLGQNAHRMSLEWSRLEPAPDRWDEAAFDRYEAILHAARKHGMTMMVTLNHFTLPRWAAAEGAWLWRELPDRFARLAARCAARLGLQVDLWVTINEPNVLAFAAYADGRWPPGGRSLRGSLTAMANQLRGHAAAYAAIHDEVRDARVGLVLNMPLFEPARPNSVLDRLAAGVQDWAFSGVLLEALRTGRLLPPVGAGAFRVDGLQGACDFLGLNYYGRLAVRFDPASPTPLGRHVQEPTIRTADTDWGQPCPRGLTAQLVRLRQLGIPLYVTENGIYDNTDALRPRFLVDHVRAVADAMARGADVRGYFHWSLVDNFEWTEGWSTRFGLVALDPRTGVRTPRPSAEVYAAICRANGVPDGLAI